MGSELAFLLGLSDAPQTPPPMGRRHDTDLGEGLPRPNGAATPERLAMVLQYVAEHGGRATRLSMKAALDMPPAALPRSIDWLLQAGLIVRRASKKPGVGLYSTYPRWFGEEVPDLAQFPALSRAVILSARLSMGI